MVLTALHADAEERRDRSRGFQGKSTVEIMVSKDKWHEAKVYLLEHVGGFKPNAVVVPLSDYGGRADCTRKATGFFRTEQIDGKWWIIDPNGCPFISVALNQTSYSRKFGPEDAWKRGMYQLLRTHGFNTASEDKTTGSGDRSMPYNVNLMLTFHYLMKYHEGSKFHWDVPPLWEPSFKAWLDQQVPARITEAMRKDRWLIGYFVDNERRWESNALDLYHDYPKDSVTYRTVAQWAEQNGFKRGQDGFSAEARRKFQGFQINYWARLSSEAVRAVDPNHLILGARFRRKDLYAPELLASAGRYFDVISANYYGSCPPDPVVLDSVARWSGKPIMITEFFAQSYETRPRDVRDGWIVRTQEDRAKFYQNYALACLQNRNCVGFHWFRYADSESANMGVVDVNAKPYTTLLEAMKAINLSKYALVDHLAGHPLDYTQVYDPLRNMPAYVEEEAATAK
jgi:hypothetical protein